jgi:hypothetical protein
LPNTTVRLCALTCAVHTTLTRNRFRTPDQYLKNYQQTRVGKIIGSGRQVQAKHKDGHLFPVRLTVTESVQATGDVIYTGMTHPLTVPAGQLLCFID